MQHMQQFVHVGHEVHFDLLFTLTTTGQRLQPPKQLDLLQLDLLDELRYLLTHSRCYRRLEK